MKDLLCRMIRMLVGASCFFLVFASMSAIAQDYKIKFSGYAMPSQEAAIVEEGVEHMGFEATWYGNGSFGNTINHAVADYVLDWSLVPCENNLGFQIAHFYRHTNILRAANGDLLFREMNTEMDNGYPLYPSVVCWDPIYGIGTLVHLDIVGGTGRFEGATGTATFINKIVTLDGQNSTCVSEEGYVDE